MIKNTLTFLFLTVAFVYAAAVAVVVLILVTPFILVFATLIDWKKLMDKDVDFRSIRTVKPP